MFQRYSCQSCKIHTLFEINPDSTPIKGVNLLQQDHDMKSPDCKFHIDNIMIYKNPLTVVEDSE